MNLHISRGKHCTLLYVAKSVREGKIVTRKLVEKLGTTKSIMEAQGLSKEEEAIEWAKRYISELNQKEKTENEEIKITLHPNKELGAGCDNQAHMGYMFIQKAYYDMGLNLICEEIQKRHKIKYDINHILESLLYARIISPSSKLRTSDDVSRYYAWSGLEHHQVYRALSVLAKESEYIQSQLFINSQKVIDRNTTVLYYDCTNFFCETEQASGIRQYGVSKEHRPNPIVEFGMFIDGNGYPLGFCVHKGNTSETQTMIPLEKKMVENYGLSKFIICTDAAMAISENKVFNSLGDKHYVTTQPIKKMSKPYQDWALSPKGWKKYIPAYETLNVDQREYDISQINEDEEVDSLFYKSIGFKQEIKDDDGNKIDIDQQLYVTFSVKYKRYTQCKREEHIQKALFAIKSKSKPDLGSNRDYKRFISKQSYTDEGEVADNIKYYLDEDIIREEAKYDGFYGVSSDMRCDIHNIINANRNRWEIEESFRVMKTDFKTRPIFVSRDDRIEAHLMTCFLSLFLYRFIEKHYMRDKYTSTQILEAIRDIYGVKVGDGVIPAFRNSTCLHALMVHTQTLLDYEFLTAKRLSTIIKRNTTNSDKIKRLFIPNKRPVGRPSTGSRNKDMSKHNNLKKQRK